MTNKDMEREFDTLLEQLVEEPPATALSPDINPWRRAMNRVLWGTGLTTLTLNFLNLDTILPAIGLILLLLGYRSLRRENRWFRMAYILSIVRGGWFCLCVFFQSTILTRYSAVATFLAMGTYIGLLPALVSLLALRNGIRAVQKKAGLPPHGGTGLVVWYLIVLLLALLRFEGFTLWLLIAAYFFILRGLCKLSGELTEAGYGVVTAPVAISDRAAALICTAILLALSATGYLFFRQYPMDWRPAEKAVSSRAAEISRELAALGCPENVLRDLTEEELLSCDGATFVVAEVRDYDILQNRGIGTQEEIDGGKIALITPEEGEAHLRFTFVGVKLSGERETYRIIHHFEWLTDVDFPGTEAIQLWPSDRSGGWARYGDVTGRLLYESGGTTLTADYDFLGDVSYQKGGILASLTGQYDNHDVFATFSLPAGGTGTRGYLMYTLLELEDGYIVSSWCNYIHQRHPRQFPVKTAMDYAMTSIFGSRSPFQIIQSALQFTTHGENPELF